MRFIRFRNDPAALPRTGLQVGDEVYDLSARYARAADFFAAYPDGWDEEAVDLAGLPARRFDSVELLPPVDDGAGLYFVGANYKKHAEEAGLDVPGTPVIFSKPSTALVASGDPIMLSPVSSQLDYEGELAVIIGRRATRVSSADAPKHVAGFTIANDVTARDLQWVQLGKHTIVDWLSSKCLDRSTPVGPGVVPASAIADPHRLHLTTRLNGETMQDSETSMMVFSIWQLIEFLSARVTLNPGDMLSTGTPVGVGGFRKIFLKQGDTVRVEVENVGVLDNPVGSPDPVA
ncbi:MAG: fumarylacetoacetate hydrolase family protein [Gammaproteobacteria bacterium]|nr:fumarylacetoacetate hydrolase family protein [Gammaproteobacteria bacterium]